MVCTEDAGLASGSDQRLEAHHSRDVIGSLATPRTLKCAQVKHLRVKHATRLGAALVCKKPMQHGSIIDSYLVIRSVRTGSRATTDSVLKHSPGEPPSDGE